MSTDTFFNLSSVAFDSIQISCSTFQAPLRSLCSLRHLEHVVYGQRLLLVEVERLRFVNCVLGLPTIEGPRLAKWPNSTPGEATTEADSWIEVVESFERFVAAVEMNSNE